MMRKTAMRITIPWFRAIRFCLRIDIFRTQLRAILRASAHGNVKIMYPMISGLAELREANEVLEALRRTCAKRAALTKLSRSVQWLKYQVQPRLLTCW